MTRLRIRLTACACVLAFVVVGLGAFTRLVDAGLGCPDWPGCYGHMLWPNSEHEIASAENLYPHAPVDTDKTWPEMVHRYFAGGLGLVILALAVLAHKHRRPPQKLPWLLVLLVIVQALFGMWTVTLKLWPQVVTAHLLGGFATLALLWLCFLRCREQAQAEAGTNSASGPVLSRSLKGAALIGLLVVIGQIALGGWTSSNYAALACIDLPTCHGVWWPETDFAQGFNLAQTLGPNYLGGLMDNQARTAIHLSHRLGAVLVTAILLVLATLLWRSGWRDLRRLGAVLVLVLALQVGLGITNILAALPLAVAVAHNGVGAVLLLTLVTINYRIYRRGVITIKI
ncbi:MAG: heme A synthase [Gammaproteobacteria bacterium]|uniref:COX15/CtaA family protein n=1 Tax=Pseudomaricurvus alcaniphilus TaxID=1166482 RepID=UPI00140D2A22|nr:COX15/CtaA family protein [Pseudomaricurvus alcaniphilus]MBR9912614.1 heme A synthase [Gammaproteobacteria bacterium]NHN38797.1 heme A synthase [Pseudomaricurvus alcaniphilus]